MSFKITIDDKLESRLAVHCDFCGIRIDRYEEGVALWLESQRKDNDTFDVFHAHKGDCDWLFERKNPAERDQWWMSHEMRSHLKSFWIR
jgi:hypothetical protein